MADTVDPQVVKWSNDRARTIADKMEVMLTQLKGYQADYANFGISAAITAAGNANKIADGYVTDGRQPVTGLQLQNLKASIDQIVTAWDVTAVPGVGATPRAIQGAIQVNGSPK